MLCATVQACYGMDTGIGHIVRLKSKQDSGIRSERQFRTSIGSGIDADHIEKRNNCNLNGVLQDKWG